MDLRITNSYAPPINVGVTEKAGNSGGGFASALLTASGKNEQKNEPIGLTSFGKGETATAAYSPASTEDDPVIAVTVRTANGDQVYDIAVNKVDPRSASQLEMFALLSYTDDKGITERSGFGSFAKMKYYATAAEKNGYTSGITHGTADGGKKDWIEILLRITKDFFGNAATYSQGVDCQSFISDLESLCR